MVQPTRKTPQALTPELKEIALAALNAYLHSPAVDGRTPIEMEVEGDRKRVELIEGTLKPLLTGYLANAVSGGDFKRQVDRVNKQNQLWGFSGIKGQMFFNMLLKTTKDTSECDNQLKAAIREPASEEDAIARLRKFREYVVRVGQEFVDGGGEPRSRPKASSIPFFLSYFWQIQRRDVWPIYYTNTVQMIEGMNLWQATGEIGDDYLTYKLLHETLVQIFSETAGRPFSLYDVEHVFWFKSGRLFAGNAPTQPSARSERPGAVVEIGSAPISSQPASMPPDNYVPPIVAVIPKLALNDLEFQEAAKRSGTTLDRAFEKSINAAFTVLGYETQLWGKGMGRVPDGQAIAVDEFYALLWDAKARSDGYTMGTDDRIIRQYVEAKSRELKRRGGIQKIYYLIISSSFSGDFDALIRTLKMQTHVNEVCLVEASALVAIVDRKLRAPLSVSLGPEGIQRLFSSSRPITVRAVMENLAR